jgi:hypothetical protein
LQRRDRIRILVDPHHAASREIELGGRRVVDLGPCRERCEEGARAIHLARDSECGLVLELGIDVRRGHRERGIRRRRKIGREVARIGARLGARQTCEHVAELGDRRLRVDRSERRGKRVRSAREARHAAIVRDLCIDVADVLIGRRPALGPAIRRRDRIFHGSDIPTRVRGELLLEPRRIGGIPALRDALSAIAARIDRGSMPHRETGGQEHDRRSDRERDLSPPPSGIATQLH